MKDTDEYTAMSQKEQLRAIAKRSPVFMIDPGRGRTRRREGTAGAPDQAVSGSAWLWTSPHREGSS